VETTREPVGARLGWMEGLDDGSFVGETEKKNDGANERQSNKNK